MPFPAKHICDFTGKVEMFHGIPCKRCYDEKCSTVWPTETGKQRRRDKKNDLMFQFCMEFRGINYDSEKLKNLRKEIDSL